MTGWKFREIKNNLLAIDIVSDLAKVGAVTIAYELPAGIKPLSLIPTIDLEMEDTDAKKKAPSITTSVKGQVIKLAAFKVGGFPVGEVAQLKIKTSDISEALRKSVLPVGKQNEIADELGKQLWSDK